MKWGFLTLPHILSLVLGGTFLWGLYELLRRKPALQLPLLGLFSLTGVAALCYNLIRGPLLLALPLQLCSMTALLLPVLVLTKSSFLGNLLLFWGVGAAGALIVNLGASGALVLDSRFNRYYFPHLFEFGIPVIMHRLGLFPRQKKHMRRILLVSWGAYTLAHCANLIINALGTPVNYMFTLGPTVGAGEFLFRLLPLQYWYMFLLLPGVLLYGAWLYRVPVRQLLKK